MGLLCFVWRCPLDYESDCCMYLCLTANKDSCIIYCRPPPPTGRQLVVQTVRLPTNSFFPQIVLSLGSSLWLDPVECTDILPINKITMVKFSLREDILKSKHAVENPDHIPNLRKLCSKAGIQIGLFILWTLKCKFFTSWVFVTTFFTVV